MDRKIYAIGDIHGRLDLLDAALDRIEQHAGSAGADIIGLGDYIDRGPDSCAVVETLIRGARRPADRLRCVMGNHEYMLVRVMDEPWTLGVWLENGGAQTLESYGIARDIAAPLDSIPVQHLDWMSGLPLHIETEHQIFVHAGLGPPADLCRQKDVDKIWIRDDFLNVEFDFGKHVVHGHTPRFAGADRHRYRTNLDSGAVWTGMLSVGVFDPLRPGGPVDLIAVTDGVGR